LRPPASPTQSSQLQSPVWVDAEPGAVTGFETRTSAHVGHMVPPQATTAASPDYEAHFTLGIAYKHMELFQEAREEFNCSREGEAYYLDSSLMTALCHKEEGHLVQALTELELVLVDPRCQGTKSQAIRYELGLLYEAEAQWGKALATFQSIPSFHDVPQRLAALTAHRSSEVLRLAS
jgi:tetratricopeptide (TPR) repeat protein